MKLIKFGILAAAATFILGTFSAKATIGPIGTVTNSSKLNISIVVTTNGSYSNNGKVAKMPTGTIKITDKQLLELFAHWDGDITWPSGAHLVQGWDEEWDGDVLVVDKSGKNVLFDADLDPDQFFIIDIFDADGASGYTESDSAPGSYTQTSFNSGDFELFDDISGPTTDLFGNGPDTHQFSESWNASDVTTKWSDSEKFKADNAGHQSGNGLEFSGNTRYTTVHAELDSSGHGSGHCVVFWIIKF